MYRFTDSTVMPKDSRRECELHFYYELITLLLWKDDFTPHYTCKLIIHLVMTIQLLPLPLKKLGKIVNGFHFKETIQVFIGTYIHTYIHIYIYIYIMTSEMNMRDVGITQQTLEIDSRERRLNELGYKQELRRDMVCLKPSISQKSYICWVS